MATDISADDRHIDIIFVARASWTRRWRILLVTLLVLLATAGLLAALPRYFVSSATILVAPPAAEFAEAGTDFEPGQSVVDAVTGSLVESLKSRDILLQVIARENLREFSEFRSWRSMVEGLVAQMTGGDAGAYSDEELLGEVASRLSVVRQGSSSLVSIRFRSTNPDRAARIVNSIVALYLSMSSHASQIAGPEVGRGEIGSVNGNSDLFEIRVISNAVSPVDPANPDPGLILWAVSLVALVVQIGGVSVGVLLDVPPRRRDGPDTRQHVIPMRDPATRVHSEANVAHDARTKPARTALAVTGDKRADLRAVPPAHAATPVIAANADLTGDREAGDPFESARALNLLLGEIAKGREKLIFLMTPGGHSDAEAVSGILLEEALSRGINVALVDAGSWKVGEDRGLSDLCGGKADFGEVVHRREDGNLATVPWGRTASLDLASRRGAILVSALSAIYDLVVVQTGRSGPVTALPMFAGLDGRVLVAAQRTRLHGSGDDLIAAVQSYGFAKAQMVWLPSRRAKTA